MGRRIGPLLLLGTLLSPQTGAGAAEPEWILRMATSAPEGTSWARELNALSATILAKTHGTVRLKWYFGGIAGDEFEVANRLKREQLDGAASGGPLCQKFAPSMRVMSIHGLFNTRDEAAFVMNRLKPTFDEEFRQAGLVHLTASGLGPNVIFLRRPVKNLDELKRVKLWRWNQDVVAALVDRELGFDIEPLPAEAAAQAYDEGRIDGFAAIPSAALAFQWFTRAHYFMDLQMGYLWGCLVVTNRAFNRLPIEAQTVLRTASAKVGARFDEVGRRQDGALLGGLFAGQGLRQLPVAESVRTDLLAAARRVRERLGEQLAPPALLEKVLALLADFRSEHPARAQGSPNPAP